MSILYKTQCLMSPACQLFTNASNPGSWCYFWGHWCPGFLCHYLQGPGHVHQLARVLINHHSLGSLGCPTHLQVCIFSLQKCTAQSYHVSLLIQQQDNDGTGLVIHHATKHCAGTTLYMPCCSLSRWLPGTTLHCAYGCWSAQLILPCSSHWFILSFYIL